MRRLLLGFGLLILLLASGCTTSDTRMADPETGPAFARLKGLRSIRVMPVVLPDVIEGQRTEEEEEKWLNNWPMDGVRYLIDGIDQGSEGRIQALTATEVPTDGFYVKVVITYLSVGGAGERTSGAVTGNREGWSHVIADCYIYEANSDELAAKLSFERSSGYDWSVPFDRDMTALGKEIGLWLHMR